VNVPINTAAIAPRRRQQTPEGIELHLATDVTGYFWMIAPFRDLLDRLVGAALALLIVGAIKRA
jgi:hypothetical protein